MVKKKKIAILLPWLKMGGTNKIAINFIRTLLPEFDVTLILNKFTGELIADLPKEVHLIEDPWKSLTDILKKDFCSCNIFSLIKDALYYANLKLHGHNIDNYSYIASRLPVISNINFDCAISFHGQSPELLVHLSQRITSKIKIAWLHGEFSPEDKHYQKMAKYYKQLDYLFFVSPQTCESFRKKIDISHEKCIIYKNPIYKKDIIGASFQTEDVFAQDSSVVNILTVGRISPEKGQVMIPGIMEKLLQKHPNIHWYLIGDGPDRPKVEEQIKKLHLENHIHLMGTKQNPYGYMRTCDIYVQPSYTEGFSTTITEASILGKAIIGTIPSGGITLQIEHEESGLIVDASVPALLNAIEQLVENPDLRDEYSKNVVKSHTSDDYELDKFKKILP